MTAIDKFAYPDKPGPGGPGGDKPEKGDKQHQPSAKKPKNIKRKFVEYGLFQAELDRFLQKELHDVSALCFLLFHSMPLILLSSGRLCRNRDPPSTRLHRSQRQGHPHSGSHRRERQPSARDHFGRGEALRSGSQVIRGRLLSLPPSDVITVYSHLHFQMFAEKVPNRGLCAAAMCEQLRYKLCCGLPIRRACYGVLRFIMESEATGCEVIVSGKIRGQRAKTMKFVDGVMIHSGDATRHYIDEAIRHVHMKQGRSFGLVVC